MITVLSFGFYALCAFIIGFILVRYLTGRAELLNPLNFFLLGLIFFQFVFAPDALRNNVSDDFLLSVPERTGQIYLFWSVLFLGALLVAMKLPSPARPLMGLVIKPVGSVTADRALIGVVIFTCVAAAFFKFGLRIPFIGVLASFVALSLSATAAGLAAWLLVRNLFNPAAWLFAVPVMGAMVYLAGIGEYSRRPVLNVVICVAWAAYFGVYRYQSPTAVLPKVAILMLGGALVMGMLTVTGRDVTQLDKLFEPSAYRDAFESVTETYITPSQTAWLIEANMIQNRGFTVTPFQSITYFFAFPIPRMLWESVEGEKPYTVSTYLSDWANRQGVRRGRAGVTSPAGIIGNPAAEYPFPGLLGATAALLAYAVFYAWIIRLFDDVGRHNVFEPLIIVPVGSMMGQMFGIPRGESSVFAFSFVFGTFCCLLLMSRVRAFLARLGFATPLLVHDDGTIEVNDEYQAEADGYAEYGEREDAGRADGPRA